MYDVIDFRAVNAILSDPFIIFSQQYREPIFAQSLDHQFPKLPQIPQIIKILPPNGPTIDHLHNIKRIPRNPIIASTDLRNSFLQQHRVHFPVIGRTREDMVSFEAGYEIVDYDVMDYAGFEESVFRVIGT